MNNNNSTHRSPSSCGNVARGRKRKAAEHDDHEMVARSNSGAVHQIRPGTGFNHESRIVRVSRSSGGKDRHSKVLTAKGLRDRRVRLSVSTAIQFYDLQDRLRLDQPSKAVEWLLKAASHAIDELPVLDHPFHGTFSNAPLQLPNTDTNTIIKTKAGDVGGGINVFAESSSARGMSSNNDSPSSKEGHQGQCDLMQCQQKQQQAKTAFGKGKMTSSKSSIEEDDDEGDEAEEDDEDRPSKGNQDAYYSALSLSRSESSPLKARERCKKTAKETYQFQIPATAGADPAVRNQVGDNDGARDSFTGLLNSVAHVALESRDTDHNTKEFAQRRRTTSLSMNILHHDLSHSHTHALSTPTPPSLDHLFHDQSQPPHILHSGSLVHHQSYGSQSFAFPTFVNAAIFSPLSLQRNEVSKSSGIFSTSQEQKHHLVGSTAHFASIPNMQQQQQQQQQHSSFVDQEEQNVVPITSHDHMNMMNFSMPGLSGRDTLQSNSYNTMAYHMSQRIQPIEASIFTTTRNVHVQGGFDNRVLQRSMQDLESESSGRPAFKGTTKIENHYK